MPQPHIPVSLTFTEYCYGSYIGFLRQFAAWVRKNVPDWEDGSEMMVHVGGANGEAAWHKFRGIFWPAPVGTFKDPDAEGCLQIRTTRKHFYKVKPKDRPDSMVIFLDQLSDTDFEIVGCMMAGDAQDRYELKDYYGKNSPCHKVPYGDLESVQEFLKLFDELLKTLPPGTYPTAAPRRKKGTEKSEEKDPEGWVKGLGA